MNIAELFVRIRGDTSDVTRKMKGVQDSLTGLDRSTKSSHVSLGRLGGQFADLAGRIAGVHPIVGKLSEVLGSFAIGAGLTVGVLAGVAAVAVVYDKLTAASRKAMEAGDKLIDTYNRAARISALGIGGQLKADLEDIAKGTAEHGKAAGFLAAGAAMFQGTAFAAVFDKLAGGHTDKIKESASAAQQVVNQLGVEIGRQNDEIARKARETADKVAASAKQAQQDFQSGITSTLAVFDNLTSHGAESAAVNARLIADYQKLAGQIRDMGTASGPAAAELLKLRDALMANLVVAQAVAAANSTGTVGPLVGKALPGMSLTPDLSPRNAGRMPNVGGPPDIVHVETATEKQTRQDKEHHDRLVETISNTASQIASVVGNAILTVGSGRGAQIGAAIGGAAGSGIGGLLGAKAAGAITGEYLGAAAGSVIPVVGTIVGGLIGSAIGGLFGGHKKAVDNNTQALNANTAVMQRLLNAPEGFKVAALRYDATHVQAMGVAARKYSTRGGVNPLLVGT